MSRFFHNSNKETSGDALPIICVEPEYDIIEYVIFGIYNRLVIQTVPKSF